MINNVNANQVGHLLGKPSPANPDSGAPRTQNDADAALQVRFGDLINKAKNLATEDTRAVEEARALLDSGRLTSKQNIESAARDLLDYGI